MPDIDRFFSIPREPQLSLSLIASRSGQRPVYLLPPPPCQGQGSVLTDGIGRALQTALQEHRAGTRETGTQAITGSCVNTTRTFF